MAGGEKKTILLGAHPTAARTVEKKHKKNHLTRGPPHSGMGSGKKKHKKKSSSESTCGGAGGVKKKHQKKNPLGAHLWQNAWGKDKDTRWAHGDSFKKHPPMCPLHNQGLKGGCFSNVQLVLIM